MSSPSPRDPNRIPAQLGISNADHETPINPEVDADNLGWLVNINNALITKNYDYVGVAYPQSDTEVYTFKTGGSGGTTVAIVTVVYTDSTKADLSSVTLS